MSGRSGYSEWERQQRRLQAETERERRADERARVAEEKERKRQYVERRKERASAKNQQLEDTVQALRSILPNGLARSAQLDLAAMRQRPNVPEINLGGRGQALTQPDWEQFAPEPPGVLARAFGGQGRYERRLAEARENYERALQDHEQSEVQRQQFVSKARREHAARVKQEQDKADRHNQKLDQVARGLSQRDKSAVEDYATLVLHRTPLPEGFPRQVEVTFNPHQEQLVAQVELPPRDVVPAERGYQYMPTKDEERVSQRKPAEVAELYRGTISQVALLLIRDLFNADAALQHVGFNGHVHATNPATGEQEYPCLISVEVERDSFPVDKNLQAVEPPACLQHLKALVSSHPYDLKPVEPILDFDLTKYRFIDGFDAVSTLDSRPDLMQMSPEKFEHLVRQVFEAQGMEGWTTEQSKDDGVDAVIAKRTALIGGLSIVQAKRYSKAVGVGHYRELAGAMEEKKAGWGILVTTSWFTADCWRKSREHARMELIDGSRLKALIKEHLGKDVLIGIPNRPRNTEPPTP